MRCSKKNSIFTSSATELFIPAWFEVLTAVTMQDVTSCSVVLLAVCLLLVSSLAYFSFLRNEQVRFSKTSLPFCRTALYCSPEHLLSMPIVATQLCVKMKCVLQIIVHGCFYCPSESVIRNNLFIVPTLGATAFCRCSYHSVVRNRPVASLLEGLK